MRIVSLVPSATEMVFALGLGDELVAVTHECDYPPATANLPRVTRSIVPANLTAAQIDAAVKERALSGEPIYELDSEALHELQPDLIITQELCKVCAVSVDEVRALAEEIDSQPIVVSLDPRTIGEALGDARTIAQFTDSKDEAVDLIGESSDRIDRIRLLVRAATERPKVVALEWLDPPYAAGHWTPQMIEYAGGVDVLGFAGEHSEQTSWNEIELLKPDIVLVMPCGYDAELAHREAEMHREQLAALGATRIVALDASAYFSRPGPRLVDGLELLAHVLHPDLAPANPEYEGKSIELVM